MCKLVVIDDNPTDHYIMQRLLHNNYNCEQATYTYDGRLVLDYLEKYPPKLKISNYTWFLECIRMLNLGYQYDSDTKKILKVLIKNKLNSN